MMSINLIAVGKLKEDYLRAASAEYAKRLQAFCTLKITEVDECRLSDRPSEAEIKNALETEAKVMREMSMQDILPQVIKYINYVQDSMSKVNGLSFLEETLERLVKLSNEIVNKNKELEKGLKELGKISSIEKKADYASTELKKQMEELRNVVDTLEGILPKEYWPIPTYFDILS